MVTKINIRPKKIIQISGEIIVKYDFNILTTIAIVVNILKSYLTIISPEIWIIFLGLIFILVTIYLPNGLTDLNRVIKKKLYDRE